MPSDSEKEQYTIRKHFEKCVGNVQKSPSNHFTVTPKLRPKHVRSMAHYVGIDHEERRAIQSGRRLRARKVPC